MSNIIIIIITSNSYEERIHCVVISLLFCYLCEISYEGVMIEDVNDFFVGH